MSEFTSGIRPEEVAPTTIVPRHIASGSGWEEWRGGGSVPADNPWRRDPPYKNPAQDGIGQVMPGHDEFQAPRGR
jgi:hypothetical protein